MDKILPCQPSTSNTNSDKCTVTEMEEDEEEDEEFHPNETDLSSDDVISQPNVESDQLDSVYHTSNCETQWPKENDEQRFRRWNAKFAEFGNENISTSAALHRELRNLSFRNPGYRCTLPVPSRATRTVVISAQQPKTSAEPSADRRSMRKRTAKKDGSNSDVQTRSAKSKLRYNNKGRLVLPSRTEVDLCDCLDQKCNGCQYQCKKCGGNKCSYACRVNRTTFIEHIDTLGGGRTNNPFL
ncbi:hypothetical protein niasHS_003711 [Heterodera schachtii]|uniref:ARF7 effector protein C-terminal domain-containing protein n=1 Tax=Heterodera schachtii TaxID=97005 RepID=A0ABD2KHA3_HETSC